MSERDPFHREGPSALVRLADRTLLGLAGLVVLGCGLALWYAVVRPTTPHGGSYAPLMIAVGCVLAACVAFLLLRRRVYRRVGPLDLCLIVGGALLPLLLFEIVANAIDLRGFLYYAQSERYFRWQKYAGVAVAHAHPADAAIGFRWGTVRTNAEGWRSPPIAEARDPRTLRILGLGDSVMFSWGVDEPDTLRAALERALTARLEELPGYSRVEVINTGNCSFSSVDELIVLRSRGLAYDPSAVLVLAIDNDFVDRPAYQDQVEFLRNSRPSDPELIPVLEASARPRADVIRARTGWKGTAFYTVAYALKRSFLATTAGDLARSLRSREPEASESGTGSDETLAHRFPYLREQTAALRDMAQLLNERKIPLLIAVFRDTDLTEHLRAEIEPWASLRYLEFPDELDWMTLRNSHTDAHWNREGNRLMAELLASMLSDSLRTERR